MTACSMLVVSAVVVVGMVVVTVIVVNCGGSGSSSSGDSVVFSAESLSAMAGPHCDQSKKDTACLRVVRVLCGSRQGSQRLDVMKHVTLNNMGCTHMKAETSIYYTLSPSKFGFSVVNTVSDDFTIVVKTPSMMKEIKGGLDCRKCGKSQIKAR